MGGTKRILIAEAGSSKTQWSLLNGSLQNVLRFDSNGINPVHLSPVEIQKELLEIREKTGNKEVTAIKFFGAGCVDNDTVILRALREIFNCEDVEVKSDMVAAAFALFGNTNGIAAILGTGSNSCFWENEAIRYKIPSLGYVLGDEGSGVALGKALLNAVFKKGLPDEIATEFQKRYHLSVESLIQKTYKDSRPAKFLASFAPFLLENANREEVSELILNEFSLFFQRNIMRYPDYENLNIGFVGSIAFHFQNHLLEVAEKHKIKISKIMQHPLPALEEFYSNLLN